MTLDRTPIARFRQRARHRTRGRWLGLIAAGAALLAAAPAQAAPQWLTPQTVSPPGQESREQQAAFDQNGDATLVWQSNGVAHTEILASTRAAGGSYTAPQTLSNPNDNSEEPAVASDAQGDAIAAWLQDEGGSQRLQAAYRPAGGVFGTPQTLSRAGAEAIDPRVAMNAGGEAVVVWSLFAGGQSEVQATTAAPGAAFGAPVGISGPPGTAMTPQVALDAHGNAIVVWEGWDGANMRIADAVRPAGSGFQAPAWLSPSGDNAGAPQIAFDASGNALAVWRFDGPPASTIQTSYRPVGGSFEGPQQVSVPSSEPAQNPQVAFDGEGEGVVAWQQSDGSEMSVLANVRTPGTAGLFGTQSTLDSGSEEAFEPQIAGDGLSGTVVSWETFNGIDSTVQTAVRPAGGSFEPATALATGALEGFPVVGIDAQGDAIAAWTRYNGSNDVVEAAGYANAGPQLRGLTIPTQGTVGQPLQFFGSPLDVWSATLTEGFSFGDGTTTTGVSATHVYTAPGTYQVSATATDALGNVTTVTRTVTIVAPPAAGSGDRTSPKAASTHHKRRHHKRRRHGRRHGHHGRRHGRHGRGAHVSHGGHGG